MSDRAWPALVFTVALATGALLAFAPFVSNESCVADSGGSSVCTSESTSLLHGEGPGVAAVLAFPALVTAVALIAPSRRSTRWTAIALTGAGVLAIASLGLFFIPTVVLAWVAACQSSVRPNQRAWVADVRD
jgi:hypothetical protein